MLQRFLFPRAIVWPGFVQNGFSYNVLAASPDPGCAKVIQILPEFWATIQMRPEFLRATLSPAMH